MVFILIVDTEMKVLAFTRKKIDESINYLYFGSLDSFQISKVIFLIGFSL
jgi:hypothetical protein